MQSIYRISKTNIEFHEHTYMFGEHMYAMHQCVSVWTKDSSVFVHSQTQFLRPSFGGDIG